ncbi:hypothetical protein [Streptomyces sp. AMCC400023]|uniref:hypothetical protein n=1 Tax=Streptomyces sp. AMCC400023 TaxID=2056258 RepID=UPI001F4456F6|nr:hypothetical protein [Streptomyces sp. AMCC400023]UJV42065.1 hypothetical protein CVT30_21425 [Streptomyces sp. AMCC400023]
MSEQLDPKSPSMRLWHALVGRGIDADEATMLMNGYAHELAERIRQWAAVEVSGEIEEIYGYAADMIDPESEDYIGSGPARPGEEPTP